MASVQSSIILLSFSLLQVFSGVYSATFTIINKCSYTVWPGILSNAGTAQLSTTGFTLQPGESNTLDLPTSWSMPDSPKTGDTWFGKKALASDFPLLRRELLKGYSHPSAPNPDTYIPASTSTSTNHKAPPAPSPEFPFRRRKLLKGYTPPSAPNPDTYIPDSTSSSTNHKAPTAPSPEFRFRYRKLLKGYTPPSAPNPDTYIPASTSSSTNHKAAPAPPPGSVL